MNTKSILPAIVTGILFAIAISVLIGLIVYVSVQS